MKNLYQKIIRFFTTQTIPSQAVKFKTKKEKEKIKQLIRNEVRKQLNKKK